MNLYKYLKETALLNQLKDTMLPNFYKAQDLIAEYVLMSGEENAVELLDKIQVCLENIVAELENLGYNYEPEMIPDEQEAVFKDILNKYREQLAYFINNFSEDAFESFNSQTRYVINLIDVHKVNFKS